MIHKYYYELVYVWYLTSWAEECLECGHFSEKVVCPKCKHPKSLHEEEVKDKQIIQKLCTMNREVIERLERELREKKPE